MSKLEDYLKSCCASDRVYTHQKCAIDWLEHRIKSGKSALLADAMGLGKTLDIALLFQITLPHMSLVVCPTSCVYSQWIRTLCQYSTYFKIYKLESHKVKQCAIDQHTGSIIETGLIPLESLYLDPHPYKIIVSNFHGIVPYPAVTPIPGKSAKERELGSDLNTYIHELTPLNQLVFDLVVVDEVHKIRNGVNTRLDDGQSRKKMMTFYRMMRLRMNPTCGVRIGLTGTPIQNRISDVVSILTFLGVKFSPSCLSVEVKNAIKEYMFRRTEDNLHPALRSQINFPEVDYEEIVKDVLYETPAEADIYKIIAGAINGRTIPGQERNPYSRIPYDDNPLVKINREVYVSASINMFINQLNTKAEYDMFPRWCGSESKLNMEVADILDLAQENESLIIFIHFHFEREDILRKMYQVGIETEMGPTFGYQIYDINGDVDPKDRDTVIKDTKICIESGRRCICFCTITSSSDGLNLQHFSRYMFTICNWNPAMEWQAVKRLHRIGQKRVVRGYKYIHRYLLSGEGFLRNHVDIHKEQLKSGKRDKFDQYLTEVENAAHSWPIRDMPGFEGEKSVTFERIEDLLEDTSSISGQQINDFYSAEGVSSIQGMSASSYIPSKRSSSKKASARAAVDDVISGFSSLSVRQVDNVGDHNPFDVSAPLTLVDENGANDDFDDLDAAIALSLKKEETPTERIRRLRVEAIKNGTLKK